MQQVVDEAGLTWLETPDQAVVWGTALGLQDEIEGVLRAASRTSRRARTSGVRPVLPALVPRTRAGRRSRLGAAAGSGGSLFSGSGDPRPRRDDVGARDDRELARRRRAAAAAAASAAAVAAAAAAAPAAASSARSERGRRRQAPNRSRHASRPSIVTGGRGRARQRLRGHPELLGRRAATPSGAISMTRSARSRASASHAVRRRVVEERLGLGRARAEPVEGERRAPPRASPCRSRDPGTADPATSRCGPCR